MRKNKAHFKMRNEAMKNKGINILQYIFEYVYVCIKRMKNNVKMFSAMPNL